MTTGGNGTVQDNIRTIQQRISVIDSNGYGQSKATGFIMGVINEQSALISRNNNHSNEFSVRALKVKRINSYVTTNGYDIDDPEPGNVSVNELDANADMCCLGANFTVLLMTSITADVYPYNPL